MTTATLFSNEMTSITGNTGGNVAQLTRVTVAGSRKRNFIGTIALAAQAIGSVIGVARLPKGAIITGIGVQTDTSLGTATIEFGDANTPAKFGAAATVTTIETRQMFGLTASLGVPLDGPNYDCVTGLVSQVYEDIVLTVGVAALPGAGNLKVFVDYAID